MLGIFVIQESRILEYDIYWCRELTTLASSMLKETTFFIVSHLKASHVLSSFTLFSCLK